MKLNIKVIFSTPSSSETKYFENTYIHFFSFRSHSYSIVSPLPATPSSRPSVLTFNIFGERQSSNVGNLQLSVGKLQISASPSCFREDSEADHASPDSPQQEPVLGPNISFCASDHSYAIGTSPRILANHMQILEK